MIAETLAVCVTVLALYGMRLHEARVVGAAQDARSKATATTETVDALRSEVDALRAEIKATSGRVDSLAMRR